MNEFESNDVNELKDLIKGLKSEVNELKEEINELKDRKHRRRKKSFSYSFDPFGMSSFTETMNDFGRNIGKMVNTIMEDVMGGMTEVMDDLSDLDLSIHSSKHNRRRKKKYTKVDPGTNIHFGEQEDDSDKESEEGSNVEIS